MKETESRALGTCHQIPYNPEEHESTAAFELVVCSEDGAASVHPTPIGAAAMELHIPAWLSLQGECRAPGLVSHVPHWALKQNLKAVALWLVLLLLAALFLQGF